MIWQNTQFKKKKKIIFFGNGGSASDSQHLATELVVKFKKKKNPISALSLTTDTSILTAIGNDFDFEFIFTRQLQALYSKGDLVIPISTSGNSKNIINALKYCKKIKAQTFSFLGNNGGKAIHLSKNSLIIPSNDTARIQEFHILIGHILCEFLDEKISAKK